jgi:hypothetical protein
VRYDDRGNPYRKERIGGQFREIYLNRDSPSRAFSLRIDGIEQASQQILALGASVNGIFRIAARRSGTRMKNELKALLPSRGTRSLHNGKRVLTYGLSGQLKKSISVRVVTSRTGVVHGVIGPSRQAIGYAFKAYHKPTKDAPLEKNVMVRVKPSNYWHLYEKGFTAKLWGSGRTKSVPGKNLLPRVLGSNLAVVQRDTAEVFDEQINKILNRRQALTESLL